MTSSIVSRRYAKALLMVGTERNSLDQFVRELEILRKYLEQDKVIIEAEVRSVVQLTTKDIRNLQDKLSRAVGKNVRLKNIIDTGLIGGVVIKIGDTLIDGSVTKKLALMKKWIQQPNVEEGRGIKQVFMEEPEVKKLLDDPQVPPQEKRKVLDRIIQEGIGPIVANFLYLILDKKREAFYPDIIREFRNYVDEAKNIVHAQARSAIELTAEETLDLQDKLSQATGKNVHLQVEIDRSLIGGIVIKVGDNLIDGSVKRKLSLLKKSFGSGSLK